MPGVVSNFRGLDYLAFIHHYSSYCGDRDTLKTVVCVKAVKRRRMAISLVNSEPVYVFLIWLSVLYT